MAANQVVNWIWIQWKTGKDNFLTQMVGPFCSFGNRCLPILCSVLRLFFVCFFLMWFSFQWSHADTSVQTYIGSAQQVPELFLLLKVQWNYVKHVSCVLDFLPLDLILCRLFFSKNMVWNRDPALRCLQDHKLNDCFLLHQWCPCHQCPPLAWNKDNLGFRFVSSGQQQE